MASMTPLQLIELVMAAFGVENANQLAPLIGIPASQIRGWMRGSSQPGYEHTMNLIMLAGLLDIPGAPERVERRGYASVTILESLEELVSRANGGVEVTQEELLEAAAKADALARRLESLASLLRGLGRDAHRHRRAR